MDASIAISIGDVQRTVRGQCQVGRVMERRAGVADRPEVHAGGARVRGTSALAQHPHQLPLGRELLHGVVEIVGAIHRVVRTDRDPVRSREEVLSPRADESAVAVEDDDGMVAPVEDEDPVVRVGRDAGDLDETPTIGQRPPAFTRLEARLIACGHHGIHSSNSRAMDLTWPRGCGSRSRSAGSGRGSYPR